MKGNSDTSPQIIVKSNDKTQVRYNITPVSRTNMDGTTRDSFDWDYVEIEGEVTRDKIIDAIISAVYSKDAEFALLNNKIAGVALDEYEEYQLLRANAKVIADGALGN